jgi:hypothetical protein
MKDERSHPSSFLLFPPKIPAIEIAVCKPLAGRLPAQAK